MKELIYIRHGERVSLQDDMTIIDQWKASQRYKENPFDEPLTDRGIQEAKQTGINLPKITDITKYNHIYCSPLTRCIETAINMIESIHKITGKRLKIRIEYAFNEIPYILGKTISLFNFTGLTIKETFVIPNEIPMYKPIDDALKFANLLTKYGEHIDATYISSLSDDTLLTDQKTTINNFINALNRIITSEDNIMMCCHGGEVYYLLYNYLTNKEFDYNKMMHMITKTGSRKKIIFVSMFKQKMSYWKNVMKAQRII